MISTSKTLTYVILQTQGVKPTEMQWERMSSDGLVSTCLMNIPIICEYKINAYTPCFCVRFGTRARPLQECRASGNASVTEIARQSQASRFPVILCQGLKGSIPGSNTSGSIQYD